MIQKTIAGITEIRGTGLHSGREICLRLLPADADTGVIFRRSDISPMLDIPAHAFNISSTELSTTIGNGIHSVATIEHLMAAFFLLGIDNVVVEVDGPEIPILDGSAGPFLRLMRAVGIQCLGVPRSYFVIKKRFEFMVGDQSIIIEPSDKLAICCTIDFSQNVIGQQVAHFSMNEAAIESVSEARTFCHINDVNAMRRKGLALGGSLDNAIVVSDAGVINENGLRSDNEFAQHKLLDLIGDFYLMGSPIVGRISAHKPGHTLHAQCMTELLLRRSEFMSFEEPSFFDGRRPMVSTSYAFG